MKKYFVYIITNSTNKVLYIGVTNNLIRRIYEHKNKLYKGFSEKYNCTKLVYYDESDSIISAINYEKKLKNWRREWKINLIKKENPEFKDLSVNLDLDFTKSLDPEINSG